MAGPASAAPTGFSYAQAARGPSKPATTHKANASVSATDSLPSKEWSEEPAKAVSKEHGSNGATESSKQTEIKSSIVERAKSEDKPHPTSGVSSPDIAASSTSHDDVSSAVNGSSQTSWEAKSQVSESAMTPSEPSWIAEREKRQGNTQQKPDGAHNDGNNPITNTTVPAPKSQAYHDAPLPSVNPWTKRAEDAKTKTTTPTTPKTPAGTASNDAQHKPTSNPAKAHASAPSLMENNALSNASNAAKQNNRPSNENSRPARSVAQRSSEQIHESSIVRDNGAWPTPETSVEAEKKSASEERAQDDKAEEGQGKPRKKQEWKPVPVVPNIIWQTPGVRDRPPRSAATSERAPRGGAGSRGRGGFRGAPNASAAERSHNAEQGAGDDASTRGRPDAAEKDVASSSRPARASSGSSRTGNDRGDRQQRKTAATRALSAQSGLEPSPNGSATTEHAGKEQSYSSVNGVEPAQQADSDLKQDSSLEQTADSLPNGFPAKSPASGFAEHRNRESSWNGAPRGASRRGGRGRGGSREVANGHAYPFTNGHPGAADFTPFGMPMSPTFSQRGGHQMFNSYGRAGARAAGNRTSSYPMDQYYSRFAPPFMGAPLSPIQTFHPAMTDMNGFPASAIGFPGQTEPQVYILGTVSQQIDFYFSVDNLLGDIFLRKHMDSQGYVFLDVLAKFKKLQTLTTDREVLKAACLASTVIEIKVGDDGKERVRKVSGWEKFVLPMNQRDESSMNEGPQRVEPVMRQPAFPMYGGAGPMQPQSHPASPYGNMSPMGNDMRSPDHNFMPMSMISPQAMFAPDFIPPPHINGELNGEDMRSRHFSPPHQVNGSADMSIAAKSEGSDHADADSFPNQQIEQLTVCVKMSKERLPFHNSTSRTFSNGSIDTSVVSREGEKDDGEKRDSSETSNKARDNQSAQDVSVFWIKDNDNPVGLLPSDLVPEPYIQLRQKALEQRQHAAMGTCPYDLDVLYQFWSHFLIRNFNNSMYSEFKHLAQEDATQRNSNVGHKNLIKYYDQALNSANHIPVRVAKDYLALAQDGEGKQDSLAFKNLHRSWRDGALNLRNRKRVSDVMDADLRKVLEA